MKTIEQLGISPAPWELGSLIIGCDGLRARSSVDAYDGSIVAGDALIKDADSRLIAAAPELYEALAALLNCAEREAPFSIESGMSIAMDMARKAITEAGGAE